MTKNATGELKEKRRLVKTTVGRALLSELLPRGLSFDLVNQDMTKKRVQATSTPATARSASRRP